MKCVLVEHELLQQQYTLLHVAYENLRNEKAIGRACQFRRLDGDHGGTRLGSWRDTTGVWGGMEEEEESRAWGKLDHELDGLAAAAWGSERFER
jgi:hypothetical protein